MKEVLKKHDGLLDNLTLSMSKLLVPQKPKHVPTWTENLKASYKKYFNMQHIKSNKQYYGFYAVFWLIMIILAIHRGVYFKDFANLNGTTPNPFYLTSRIMGRLLLFTNTMILVTVLR